MSHINISVNTEDVKDIAKAIALLQLIAGGKAVSPKATTKVEVETAGADDDVLDIGDLGEEEEDDDGLGDLLEDDDEPELPTIEDLKDAFKAVVKAKGKDEGTAYVKKVLGKLKVTGMKEIPEDKRQPFIDILSKFANK